MGRIYWFGRGLMLSTGIDEIDNLFKKASTISSKHKIMAEWNQNAYVGVDYLGSYPISILANSRNIAMTNYIGNGTTTVTGTSTTSHGLFPGDYVTISGATGTQQTKLNGNWKILSIPTSVTFTFAVSSAPTSGTLTTGIGTTNSSDLTYAKSFNSTESLGGWDNGGFFYTVSSTSATDPVENVIRKKLTSLKEIVSPERPDPGIVYPLPYHSLDPTTSSSNISIFSNSTNLRTYNLLNSNNRLYAINESQSFRYWTSARYCKPNSTVTPAIDWDFIGVSDANGRMLGNNVFVKYETELITNKIVVKTQTINGYPKDFSVEVIRPGSLDWVKIYQVADSTLMSDGILRLTANLVNDQIVWTASSGVETEATVTELNVGMVADVDQISGIRFSVQELSRTNGTLDVIEVSPRLVVDMTSYTSEFSKNSSIGDSTLGLPVGSLVSSSGSIRFFNDDNLISNKNSSSLLNGLLKPNVKFTILNVIEYEGIVRYVPIKVMYADSWDEMSDWVVNVQLKDYFKFLDDMPAPDILMGAMDGINVSAIIKILLDNSGFTRYSFNKTADLQEYLQEDTRLDFFWSKKEMSVAQVLGEIAKSAQLSMFFDQFGYLTVMTKEAVMQKTDSWNYTLVGDYNEVSFGDKENDWIPGNYMSNIEQFEDTVLPPINSGEVAYSGLGIPKISYQLLDSLTKDGSTEDPFIGISTDTKKLIDSGYSELSINRNLAYNPQQVWMPGGQDGSSSFLSSGILIKDLKSSRPKTILSGDTFSAKNKNDAIRKAYDSMSEAERSSSQIVIAENDMAVAYRNKFSGYVLIDAETIKYNGIVYYISKPGFVLERKIYFSENEVNSELYSASTPSGSSFVPYALLVDMDMAVDQYPTTENSYIFYCKSDGRGFNNTKIVEHYCGLAENNGWEKFSSKLYAAPTGTINYGQSMTMAVDVKLPNLATLEQTSQGYGGYVKLVGPPTNAAKNAEPSEDIKNGEIFIKDVGQQFITGFKKDLAFTPTRVGTRMNIHAPLNQDGTKNETLSKIAGFAFYVSGSDGGSTGYFLEVAAVDENYDIDDPKKNNVKFYRVYNDSGTIKPKLLAVAWWKDAIALNFDRAIQYLKENEGGANDTSRAVFSAEVGISNDKKVFTVFLNGKEVVKVRDDSPLTPTNTVALFTRDDSNAIYDYIYAVSTPNGIFPEVSDTKEFDSSYSTGIEAAQKRGIFSPYIKNIIGSETPVFYDDFGSAVREAKFIEARYTEPAFSATLVDMSRVSPDYFIKDFVGTSWGASFWIYNTARNIVPIGQGADFPIFISGFPLRKINQGTVSIGDHLLDNDINVANNELEVNRRLYGDSSVNISGEYISNYSVAQDLAEWVARYASKEKIQIDASIFPNPLLQLGDKIKVFYKARGYTNSQIGDKTYVLSGIDYSINESGIQMSVSLREML